MSDFKTAKEVCKEAVQYEIDKINGTRNLVMKSIIDGLISRNGKFDLNFYYGNVFREVKNDPYYKIELEKLGYKVDFYYESEGIWFWTNKYVTSIIISACCEDK